MPHAAEDGDIPVPQRRLARHSLAGLLTRQAAYGAVAATLASLSDEELDRRLGAARVLGAGIGGQTAVLDLDGTEVFVKRIPLTDQERRLRSTANVFDLPVVCHYGIGSPGFGAWRELDVHVTTTNWVLRGDSPNFPLMYHWRVLPRASPSLPDDLADIERVVEYWQGSPQVRRRVEAINDASASVVVFLEYFAQNLTEWFSTHLTDSACAMVERELAAGTSFMNARGLLHFDAHFENVLTDGERLYFADFGLAMDLRFDLSAAESAFYRENLTYDRQYTTTYLVDWLVGAFHRFTREERDDYLRDCAEGAPPAGVPDRAAAIVARHAPVAVVMNEFFRRLQDESRGTPYPGRIQV